MEPKVRRRIVALVAPAMLASASLALAEPTVIRGAEEVRLVRHDVSKPVREYPAAARPAGVKLVRKNFKFIEEAPYRADGALQTYAAPTAEAPSALVQFDGVGEGIAGYNAIYVPPDTNGDVGPTQYVHTVNVDYAVFSKAGTKLLGPLPIRTLWTGFGGSCETRNDGDPVVIHDQFANRWIITQFVASSPYKECVAISTSGDATGSFHRYEYDFGSDFPDYPKVGIWPTEDAVFVTYNMFGGTFKGSRVCAYQRSKLLAGQANTGQCFSPSSSYHSFLPADLDGANLPPAGTDGYMINRYSSTLVSWRANIDWATAANSTLAGPSTVSGVASYTTACNGGGTCIAQAGTTQQLDSLGDRLMHRAAYRILDSGQQSLVVNHSVVATNTTGVRWYELRPNGSGLSTFQQGTFSPDSTHRWMGSVAMDATGNIGVGYSASSSSMNPAIRYTGRAAGDPVGTLQAEATIIGGSGSQTQYSRWGDYSSMNIDPADDCTFWYTTEYLTATGSFNWHTRVASFKFAGCSSGGCTPQAEICTDGLDNDCDGLIDSADSDCPVTCVPVTEVCNDGIDNDCDGLVDSADPNCQVSSYTLSASGYKVKGVQRANLSWSGATGVNVDVFRNNVKITTTANDGAHTDNIGKRGSATYVYKVCNAGTSTCSNQSTVVF